MPSASTSAGRPPRSSHGHSAKCTSAPPSAAPLAWATRRGRVPLRADASQPPSTAAHSASAPRLAARGRPVAKAQLGERRLGRAPAGAAGRAKALRPQAEPLEHLGAAAQVGGGGVVVELGPLLVAPGVVGDLVAAGGDGAQR